MNVITQYRWTKYSIGYQSSLIASNKNSYSFSTNSSLDITYRYGNNYTFDNSSGKYTLPSSATIYINDGTTIGYKYASIDTDDIGDNILIVNSTPGYGVRIFFSNGKIELEGQSTNVFDIYKSTVTAGNFEDYVYSTNPSAYPNGGVQGGYYYSRRTVSSTDTTYDLSLHNVDNATGAGSYHEGDQVTISAGEREGYEFFSWTSGDITLPNPNNSTITFSMPAKDITLAANWASQSLPSTGGAIV